METKNLTDGWKTCTQDFIEKYADNEELCMKIKILCDGVSNVGHSKVYLLTLKEVLQSRPLPGGDDLFRILASIYLRLNIKNAAKKVLSSFFQGLPEQQKDVARELLCQETRSACTSLLMDDGAHHPTPREIVDSLTALMDNFQLGEECVTMISSTVVVFLSAAQNYFLKLFRQPEQSAKQLNSIMHDCHVTMQALNRLLQRHPPAVEDIAQLQISVLKQIVENDIQILVDDLMMVDCRSCCAINMVLLLQMYSPDSLPKIIATIFDKLENLRLSPWLENVGFQHLRVVSLSAMAALSLLWGFLSMLSAEILLMEVVAGETVLVCDAMLQTLLSLDELCISSSNRVQCIKTITLWSTRMCTLKDDLQARENVLKKLAGTSCTIQGLLGYVWVHWQDQMDVVRQNCRVIFDNCLKLHILAVNCVDPQADGFLLDLVDLVLKQSWSSPGKFAALNSLVVLLGCCSFILRQPDFPAILVSQMQDQGIACHASELLDTCIQSSKALHSQMKEIPAESWLQVWVDPVVDALCGTNQKLKMHILEYLLPKIMRKDIMVLEYILSKLAATKGGGDNSGHLGAFIMCLRRARAVGMMPQTFSIHRDGSESIWDRLYHALCSHDEQVRLEAFAFLCENKRTSEILTEKEFEHIRLFIAHNLNKQSPAFRQSMLSLIRKLFFRISESYLTLLKQKKKRHKSHEDLEVSLASYYSFLSWLEDFLFSQLYPTAAFARRTISLAMLVLMVQEIHTDKNLGFWPLGNVTLNHLQTLLECLTDTFEENKREAFALLVTITARNHDLLTEEHCKALYSAALELAVSIRPQDCATAAYLFRFLLQQGKIKALIKSHKLCLQRPLTLSKKILDILSNADTSYGTRQNSLCHTLEPECTDPDSDHQFDQNQHETGTGGVSEIHETGTVGGSEMEIKSSGGLSLFSQYPSQPQHGDQSQCQVKNEQTASFQGIDVDEMWCVKDGDIPVTVQLLKVLLLLLMDQVCVADSSLVMAAANRPMYPTLHCIRCLLNDVDFGLVEECHKVVWAKYISCLLHICLHIAEVVSPVVQNSSPEGNVPKEAIIGQGLNFDTGLMAELEESQQMVTLMPEYLVVCCWRSIKEVSLLLGHLSLYLPVTQPGICLGMLTLHQVELIGSYFKQQLMESLHRGAFELAYAGFVLMCQMLWKNPWNQLQTLPQLWLEEVMTAISGDKPSSHLCATRRSAGVPFFVQAIVATESSTSGRPCFHRAVKQLLCIALTTTSEESTFKTDSQVHSMNILRTLFRDTRLGEDVAPYIADGLKVAILGFKSQYWEIRNSATLLLSALMTRIFGVKRSKDENLLSKINSQTGRAFFHKYPDLYQFLLSELESATQDFGSGGHIHLHPSLYPVLMILSHLFPSTMEGSATRFHLSAFVPFVIRCAGSPVYKTRMMAARALQSLVHKEQLASTLVSLLQQLPCHSRCSHLQYSHSHVHGLLLQIHYLLLLIPDLNTSLFLVLLKVFSRTWLDHTWLFTRSNPCALTRKLALDITDLILSSIISFGVLTDSTDLLNMQTIAGSLLSVLQVELNKDALCYYSSHTPFLPDFLSCLASLAVKYFAIKPDGALESEKIILQLLGFDSYEFRSAFLDSLVTYLHCNRGGKGNNTARSMDSKGDYLKQGEESGTICTSVEDVACEDGLLDDPVSLVWTNAVVTELLNMGMKNGGHTEIAVKAFQVLLLVPNVCSYVEEDKSKIFERLLTKLLAEKRTDIKAVIIEFSSHVFLELYKNLHKICLSETLLLVVKWGNILHSLCQEEDSQDLQLSCAKTLVLTSAALLEDKDHLMGTSVFDFWGLLILLLQADDLEVKEIAASVTAKICPVGSGGTHPEQALTCVVKAMLSLHGSEYPLHCLLATLKWLYGHDAIEYKDTEERLFDKGDINTYCDDIAFAKTLSEVLSKSFLRTKCTSTELTPNESSRSVQHVHHMPQLRRDSDHQAEQEISVILSKMQSQVLGTEILELNSVFVKTVQFYKDTQLLIIAAVLSRAVEFCNLSLRLNMETQKLLQTVKTVAQRSPVKNLLLQQLLEQKQLS